MTLRDSLTSVRALSSFIGPEPSGKIIAKMNDVLWCISENTDAAFAIDELTSTLADSKSSGNAKVLEALIFNFAQSFAAIAAEKFCGRSGSEATAHISSVSIPINLPLTGFVGGLISDSSDGDYTPPLKRMNSGDDDDDDAGPSVGMELFSQYYNGSKTEDPLAMNPRGSKGEVMQCPFCSFTSNIKKTMSRHLAKRHTESQGTFFRCTKCDKTYPSADHEKICSGPMVFEYDPTGERRRAKRFVCLQSDCCPLCKLKLGSTQGEGVAAGTLSGHLFKQHKDSPGTFFRCSSCLHMKRRCHKQINAHARLAECGGSAEFFYDPQGKSWSKHVD